MVWGGDPRGLASDRAAELHWRSHLRGGADELPFDEYLASELGRPSVGDVLRAETVGSLVVFRRYGLVVPAANVRNALAVDHGETLETWKPTLDGTLPVIVTPAGAGAAGTSLIYSHRDHDHPATDVASKTTLDALVAAVAAFEASFAVANKTPSQQLTSNSTAFQDITGMALAMGVNEVWRFHMTLRYISSAAADLKFQFTVPAGAVLLLASGTFLNNAGAATTLYDFPAATPAGAFGTAANIAIELFGTVVCNATAGNLQLQAAQNTATVENTDFVLAGSNFAARRVFP